MNDALKPDLTHFSLATIIPIQTNIDLERQETLNTRSKGRSDSLLIGHHRSNSDVHQSRKTIGRSDASVNSKPER